MVMLLLGLIMLPVVAGALLPVVPRRAVAVRHFMALGVTAMVLVCGVALLFLGEQDIDLPVVWLPGAGHWSLHVGGIGLWALVVMAGCALAARALSPVFGAQPTSWVDAAFLIGLGSANVAFLSGHFLMRYLALELAALCVAVGCLAQLRHENGAHAAGFVYLLLRVGDAGLLGAILLLLNAGGTLEVSPALQAGASLQGLPRVWVVVGLSLAVWVKVGAWPFHAWQWVGIGLPSLTGAWLHMLVMPQLGLYLLYRIAPLMASSGNAIQAVLIALALVSAAIAAELWMREGDNPSAIQVYGNAVAGALAVAFAASGFTAGVMAVLLAMPPLRLWIALRSPGQQGIMAPPGARWADFAAAVRDTVEQGVFGQGPVRAARALMKGAQVLHDTVEQKVFEQGPARLTHAVVRGARVAHGSVEQGGLESLLHGTAQAVLALSRAIQRLHTGKLRTGLLWVVLSLLAVLLVVQGR